MIVFHFQVINAVGHCHPQCDFASLLQDGDITNSTFYRYRDVYRSHDDQRPRRVRYTCRPGRPLPYHFQL